MTADLFIILASVICDVLQASRLGVISVATLAPHRVARHQVPLFPEHSGSSVNRPVHGDVGWNGKMHRQAYGQSLGVLRTLFVIRHALMHSTVVHCIIGGAFKRSIRHCRTSGCMVPGSSCGNNSRGTHRECIPRTVCLGLAFSSMILLAGNC